MDFNHYDWPSYDPSPELRKQLDKSKMREASLQAEVRALNVRIAELEDGLLKTENASLAVANAKSLKKIVVLREALGAALQIAQIGWEAGPDREEARPLYEKLSSQLQALLIAYSNDS